jgi:outer membrane receptor for Fe3+-dicitrate
MKTFLRKNILMALLIGYITDCFAQNLAPDVLNDKFHVSGSINNLANEKYFNRRITMYPGSGILPADGRAFTISMGLDI